jgi:hypothetical protein
MSLMDAYQQLRHIVNEAEDDIKKAEGGNKAAGTRVRKKMQEIKNQAQDVRVKVLENRGDEDTTGDAASPST